MALCLWVVHQSTCSLLFLDQLGAYIELDTDKFTMSTLFDLCWSFYDVVLLFTQVSGREICYQPNSRHCCEVEPGPGSEPVYLTGRVIQQNVSRLTLQTIEAGCEIADEQTSGYILNAQIDSMKIARQ